MKHCLKINLAFHCKFFYFKERPIKIRNVSLIYWRIHLNLVHLKG